MYRAEGNFRTLESQTSFRLRRQGSEYHTICPRCHIINVTLLRWDIRRARDQVKMMLAPYERLIRINHPLEKETPDAEKKKERVRD